MPPTTMRFHAWIGGTGGVQGNTHVTAYCGDVLLVNILWPFLTTQTNKKSGNHVKKEHQHEAVPLCCLDILKSLQVRESQSVRWKENALQVKGNSLTMPSTSECMCVAEETIKYKRGMIILISLRQVTFN